MSTVRLVKGLRILACVAAGLALAAVAGCGDATKASVSGKVTYKGAPVTGGTIQLTPASGTGAPFTIPINASGSFSVSDVPMGQMQVAIETDSVGGSGGMPPGMQPPKDAPVGAPKDADTSMMPKKVPIPPKYKDPKSSGLSWEIKPGKNPKDFELTD